MDLLIGFFTNLNIDMNTVLIAAAVLVLVWLAGYSGLAKNGDARRLLGGVASLALTYSMAAIDASSVPPEIVALVLPSLVAWVISALAHTGIEAGANKLAKSLVTKTAS